ncbi:MazG family protein [Kribbella qitaiheensis]|uniref:MazG family protein n=1 Tax=Kribbella qitaiheensis TaxID=1544730 RepID=UPI001FE4F85F|nr:MazG family protein [Kribbella qitaiheensis]
MNGSIKVVLTSPRVAPGLLTRTAWQAFDDAGPILAASGRPTGGEAVPPGTPVGDGGADGSSADGGATRVLAERPDVQALVGSGYAVELVDGDAVDHWTRLTAAAASGADVAWLVGDDGEPGLLRLIADALHGAAETGPRPEYEVEILHGSYDVPGARLIDLVRVMDRLRRNCPWDQEQTHETLAKYLLEETYETLEAIDSGDRDHLREELGDLLLQVVFHSRVAEDSGDEGFSIDDVSAGIVEKLIRRHPHVFGDDTSADLATVEANWETIKAAEKQRSSVLEGIPLALPALALADKVLSRSAKILPQEAESGALQALTDDHERFGAELLALVRRTQAAGVDAEQAPPRRYPPPGGRDSDH